MRNLIALSLVAALVAVASGGDKSSLFKSGEQVPEPTVNSRGEVIASGGQPTASSASLIAVEKPRLKQFNVHDIVTIIVREESKSTSEADSEMEKKASIKAQLKDWITMDNDRKLHVDQGISSNPLKITGDIDSKFEGEGAAGRADSFLTKIAAEVIDVKPNGNLVVEAKRFIKSDDEEITLGLTGIVRPTDVDITNTVDSTDIAQLSVSKTTRGIAREGQRMGWLTRLISAVSPF